MTLKIEIPLDYPVLIKAIGAALANYEGEDLFGAKRATAATLDVKLDASQAIEQITEAEDRATDRFLGSVQQEQHIDQGGAASVDQITQAEVSAGNLAQTQTAHPQQDENGKYITDHKGVMHIPGVCGNAKDPFYANGPTKGQWKKKVGITEENYNAVYANALNQVVTGAGSISPESAAGSPAQTQMGNEDSAEQAFGNEEKQQVNTQATPNDVFATFTAICQEGNPATVASATKCFTDAGLANPSLIFSRPDLAATIFAALSPIRLHGS